MKYFLLATSLAVVGCLVSAKQDGKGIKRAKAFEKSKCIDNNRVCIKARGKSGKMLVLLKGRKNDEDAVVLTFDYIHELDNNSQIIKGKAKHSFQNFAKTEFEFSDLVETTVKGVAAYKFDFMAKLEGPGANMTVEVYIIKENKTITLCNKDNYELIRRSIKFNIKIEGWQFCGGVGGDDCGNVKGKNGPVYGKYIDFGIKLQGRRKNEEPKERKPKKDKPKRGGKDFRVDEELTLELPNAVEIDGVCDTLPDGYPNFNFKDKIFMFRFPRFKSMVLYDPFMTEDKGDDTPDNSAQLDANISFVLIAFLAAFIQYLY